MVAEVSGGDIRAAGTLAFSVVENTRYLGLALALRAPLGLEVPAARTSPPATSARLYFRYGMGLIA